MGKNVRDLDGPVLKLLEAHRYPGNVRELENILEHACIRCPDNTIRAEHLPDYFVANTPHKDSALHHQVVGKQTTLAALEQGAIVQALEQTGWNYRLACKSLGVSRSTLLRRLKAYNVTRKAESK
jgi:transcriptional regulator with PAS, ATPase and Fis domain